MLIIENMSVRLLQYKYCLSKRLNVNCHVFEKPFYCKTKCLMALNKDISNSYGFKNGQQHDEYVTKKKEENLYCFGILRSVEC